MDRTKRVAEPRNDYFVVTKLVPRIRPIRWTWEIRHRSTLQIRRGSISLGIKYFVGLFVRVENMVDFRIYFIEILKKIT